MFRVLLVTLATRVSGIFNTIPDLLALLADLSLGDTPDVKYRPRAGE